MSWCAVERLGDVCLRIVDGSHNPPKGTTEGVPMLSARNVVDGGIDWSADFRRIPQAQAAAEHERTRIKEGDVLLTIVGSLGRSAVVPRLQSYFCLQRSVAVLKPGPRLDSGFLSLWLRSPEMQARFQSEAKGTAQKGVYLGQLSDFPVPLPPLDVQRRIVAKLDELLAQSRAAREQLEAVPALVEQYRQSVLAAAFRGDLTKEWRAKNPEVEPASKLLERIRAERRRQWEAAELSKMKAKGKAPNDDKWKAKYEEPEPVDASELLELPPTWCWASLEQLMVGDRTSGYGVLKPGDHVADGVRLLKSGQVRDGFMDLEEDFRIAPELSAQYARTVLRGGEVLLNLVGASIGRSAVAPAVVRDANVSRAIAVLPVREDLALWSQRWLMSPLARRRMLVDSGGSAQPVLNLELVRSLPVPVAPADERNAAVAVAERGLKMSVEALSVDNAIDEVATLERSLLAKAFRGELDLDGTDVEVVGLQEVAAGAHEKARGGRRTA